MSKDNPFRKGDYFNHLCILNIQNQEQSKSPKSESPKLSEISKISEISESLNMPELEESKQESQEPQKSDLETKALALCPITEEDIDSCDKSSTITLITNTTQMTDDERKKLQEKKISLPSNKTINIHHVATFDLNAAYEWFIKRKGSHPISQRSLKNVELERICYRHANQHLMKNIMEKKDVIKLFSTYIQKLNSQSVDLNSDYVALLRCHLEPTNLPNYFDVTRSQAHSMLEFESKTGTDTKFSQSKINRYDWIARPSQFKGYEFARKPNGTNKTSDFYPMTEYTAITLFNSQKNSVISHLIEKVFSQGYYLVTGDYTTDVDRDNNIIQSFNNKRRRFFVCFFDSLHAILSRHADGVEIELNCLI
jgi:hypothetical protein